MSEISKILVYAESVAADIVKKYPNLTRLAGPGYIAITGTASTLGAVQRWLSDNGHKHDVKR